jgi:hypothetical protein
MIWIPAHFKRVMRHKKTHRERVNLKRQIGTRATIEGVLPAAMDVPE